MSYFTRSTGDTWALYSRWTWYTAISRKVVRQNVHATIPKGNMGYDQYTVPNDCSCRTYFCCFSLALANICPWPLVAFFQISSENRADKTTPQYLSGLSRALFPTTFLETAIYTRSTLGYGSLEERERQSASMKQGTSLERFLRFHSYDNGNNYYY